MASAMILFVQFDRCIINNVCPPYPIHNPCCIILFASPWRSFRAILSLQGAGAVFKRLIEADADPRMMDSNGQNVLHHAARGGAGPRFIVEMINAWQHSGGNQPGSRHRTTGQTPPTHVKDKWGRTPLLWAVQNGHFNAVKALLAHSSDPNARDDQGETPLQVTIV